jgi:hypothetical protein
MMLNNSQKGKSEEKQIFFYPSLQELPIEHLEQPTPLGYHNTFKIYERPCILILT